MAAEVPGIIFTFKGGRREKEHSQKVCFQTDLSFGVEREVLQWIYHCFALVGPGSQALLSTYSSLGLGKELLTESRNTHGLLNSNLGFCQHGRRKAMAMGWGMVERSFATEFSSMLFYLQGIEIRLRLIQIKKYSFILRRRWVVNFLQRTAREHK